MIKYTEISNIHVELSSKCNAKCPGCPRNVCGGYLIPDFKSSEFSIERFQKVFPGSFLKQIKNILFCGDFGDPCTCNDILKIIDYVKKHTNANIRIHTNGSLRSVKFWKLMAEKLDKHDYVIWSIDGLEDTNHIYRRGTKWNKIVENAISFIKNGGNAIWEYLVFQHNEHQISEAKNYCYYLGFKQFIPKRPFGFDNSRKVANAMQVLKTDGSFDYFIYSPSENFENSVTKKINNKVIFKPTNLFKERYDYLYEKRFNNLKTEIDNGLFSQWDNDEISCMAKNRNEIYVDSLGYVHPCCFLGHAIQKVNDEADMQYYKFLHNNISIDNINGNILSIKEIFDSGVYDKIENTWSATHKTGKLAYCSRMCRKKDNAIDSLFINEK